jgi:outer membrane protein assembly factor BamB
MRNLYFIFLLGFVFFISESCSKKKDIIQPINLIASFSFELGTNGLVSFKNNSKNAIKYNWSFGDGQVSEEENPTITFQKNGSFNVKLIAINANLKDSTQSEILISNVPASNKVFICDDNGTCSLLNSKTGAVIWQFRTDKYIISSPTYHNNTLFISTTQDDNLSKIVAIDYETGLKKWEYITTRINISSPIVVDDLLYSLSFGTLYCINVNSGKLLWEVKSINFKDSSPTYYKGNIYLVSDIGLECYDAKDGKVKLIYNQSFLKKSRLKNIEGIGTFHSSPAIQNDICYYIFKDDFVGFNINTKTSKSYKIENNYGNSSSPTIKDNNAYINSPKGMVSINLNDFSEKWTFKLPKELRFDNSSPFATDNQVYFTHSSGSFAIDIKTGTEKWRNNSHLASSPNVYENIVYIATGHELKALNADSGNTIWSFKMQSSNLGYLPSPLIINEKGEAFHSSISGAKH